jgi:hypothetical protein
LVPSVEAKEQLTYDPVVNFVDLNDPELLAAVTVPSVGVTPAPLTLADRVIEVRAD